MTALNKVGGLGGYLRDQRQQARLSLRQLADIAGVSNPYLSQVERGLRKPSAEVLNQIAKALRISAEALYEEAGLLEPTAERAGVRQAILADQHLNDQQRRALLEVYEAFRAERVAGLDPASPTTVSQSTAAEGDSQ